MPTPEDIAAQQNILAAYRRTLALYLVQRAAQGGAGYVQIGVANGIIETRGHILRCKETLRSWNAPIEDHPDDYEAEAPDPASAVRLASQSSSERAGAGLEALVDLMRAQEVRSAVTAYQAHFQISCRQIEVLSAYKKLHDLLQQLDDRYTMVVRCSKGLPSDQAAHYSACCPSDLPT